MENKETPIIRINKRVDSNRKMVVPLNVVEKWGRDYYLEIYEDYIKLIPIKKEN